MRKLIFLGLAQVLLLLGGCGGGSGTMVGSGGTTGKGSGSGSGPTPNVVVMTVDSGPSSSSTSGYDVDTPFITVTVCAPGSTTNCQTIDHVEVDTGSYGLRIISSVMTSTLAAALQPELGTGGNPLVECTQFIDGFSWGPVKTADVQIAGELASAVPMQVIGDPGFQNEIPTACSGTGPEEDTVAEFHANGILGVGPFGDDCGSGCASMPANTFYYTCPANGTGTGSCGGVAVSEPEQVTNPVVAFQADNNGVIVKLPAIPEPGGSATATGSLIFGIGTQGNNGLGSATVLTSDPSSGDITTTYKGTSLAHSYFDTGSNAFYFDDSSIPTCPSTGSGSGTSSNSWFCPTTELSLSATNTGRNGMMSTVNFQIANANTLFSTYQGNTALDDLGATAGDESAYCPSSATDCAFDFGLPFFFGRTVFVAISGANTEGGPGPYFAY